MPRKPRTTARVPPNVNPLSQQQHQQLIASLSLSSALVITLIDATEEGQRRADAEFAASYLHGMVEDVCASYVGFYGEQALKDFQTTFEERYAQ